MPVVKVPKTKKAEAPLFSFAPGSRLPKKAAQKIGERLLYLGGSLEKVTPEMIVEDAKNPRSPLHKFIFDIDDTAAAYEYRLERARTIVRSLVEYYIDRKGNKIESKGWYSVIDEENRHVYRPSTFVWRNDGASQQVIDRAKRELDGWITRYETVKYLADAVKAAKVALLTLK